MDNRGEILIVDDTTANLQLLTGLLEAEGYMVRPTRAPEMAIESALANPPDLILLDIMMPGMDGFEVCEKLKQNKQTAGVPIIFITALQETVDRLRGFEVGGVDFITKPIRRDDVLARVSAQLVLYDMRERSKKTAVLRAKDLQQSENTYRTLFESSNDVIILLDEHNFIDCNAASLKMFGCTSHDKFMNYRLSELSPPTQPDGKSSKEAVNEMIALAFQKKSLSFEWTHRRTTGEDFPAEVLFTCLTLDGKEVLQANVWDISKRKQIENALKQSEESLQNIGAGVNTGLNSDES
jgi:PAS domain S-box-containing protein